MAEITLGPRVGLSGAGMMVRKKHAREILTY